MLGRLNHVAIAVKDAEKAAKIYGAAFGADISAAVPLPEHGVITVFVTLPNTKIEFIQPLGEASPIAKFLERNSDGGIHHICYDVPDIIAARDILIKQGARVLGDGQPKIGAHGIHNINGFCGLLRDVVDRTVRDAAVWRAQSARGWRGRSRHRPRRADRHVDGAQADLDHVDFSLGFRPGLAGV